MVIDNVLKNLSQPTLDFLKFLIAKDRIKIILEICEYVRRNYTDAEAVVALLKSSYPLDLEVIRRIKELLEAKLKKRLNLYIGLDPDLLGGVKVQVGNLLLDGSLRRRLQDLREKLMAIQVP
jgi:F-type H+-transporting ATPase subunit delta